MYYLSLYIYIYIERERFIYLFINFRPTVGKRRCGIWPCLHGPLDKDLHYAQSAYQEFGFQRV